MIQVAAWVKANWLLLVFLALMVSAFILLRSKPTDIASLDELSGVLGSGQPTVLEFYSNF